LFRTGSPPRIASLLAEPDEISTFPSAGKVPAATIPADPADTTDKNFLLVNSFFFIAFLFIDF